MNWSGLLKFLTFNAAKDVCRKWVCPVPNKDLERISVSLIGGLELRNSVPIHPDMLELFHDGKYIELRDGEKLRSACIYIIVGLGNTETVTGISPAHRCHASVSGPLEFLKLLAAA